jgi:hypothetical protein
MTEQDLRAAAAVSNILASATLSKEEVHRILVTRSVSEYPKLEGVPGLNIEPVSWDRMLELVAENTVQSISKLGRHPSGIITYWLFKAKVWEFVRQAQA